jgi:Ala-tRNA(Pro) deacylase
MPIAKKLEKFLKENKIKYEPIEHRIVYTAFDKAKTLRIPEKIVGKTLTLKIDPIGKPSASYGASKGYALVLIPANKNLDKKKFLKVANKWQSSRCLTPDVKHKIKRADFVTEAWIKKNLKGVKVGAVPPFGNLWRLPTFIDRSLIHQPKIIVAGGDWRNSIKISPSVFKKAIPDVIIGNFTKKR